MAKDILIRVVATVIAMLIILVIVEIVIKRNRDRAAAENAGGCGCGCGGNCTDAQPTNGQPVIRFENMDFGNSLPAF